MMCGWITVPLATTSFMWHNLVCYISMWWHSSTSILIWTAFWSISSRILFYNYFSQYQYSQLARKLYCDNGNKSVFWTFPVVVLVHTRAFTCWHYPSAACAFIVSSPHIWYFSITRHTKNPSYFALLTMYTKTGHNKFVAGTSHFSFPSHTDRYSSNSDNHNCCRILIS